jgi:hypothetical protein
MSIRLIINCYVSYIQQLTTVKYTLLRLGYKYNAYISSWDINNEFVRHVCHPRRVPFLLKVANTNTPMVFVEMGIS